MNKFPLAMISLLVMGSPLSAFANDTPPTKPTNLSAQNYAGAGAEIFWQRATDDQTVIGYDITLNGNSIGIRDALSFYDSSIQEGAELTFTVTAVDNADQRSETASFSLGGDSSNNSGSSNDITALSGLSIVRYSPTAAELFWDRSATPGLRYEISRDSEQLGTTDGTSFFDGSLSIDEPFHNYFVVAIDSNNNEVASELIVLNAGASSGGIPMRPSGDPSENGDTVPNDDSIDDSNASNGAGSSDDISALSELSIVRYSPTAAELFWDRSATPGLRYEISRDSEQLGSTDGTSFFDGSLSIEEPFHNYFVIAFDSNNNQVASELIVLNAGASSGGIPMSPPRDPSENGDTVLNDDSIDDSNASTSTDTDLIIREVLSVINTEALQEANELAPFADEDNGFTFIESNNEVGAIFSCPTSGTMSETRRQGPVTTTYNDCVVNDVVFNGSTTTSAASGINIVDFDGFSVIQDDSLLFIEEGSRLYRVSLDGREARTWVWGNGPTVFSITTTDNSVDAIINSVILDRTVDNEYSAAVDVSVTVNGTRVTVSTNDTPLESTNGDVFYTSGQIQISGDDALSIVIDADGGDASSALITVTSDGSTESETRAWSDDFHVECLSQVFPLDPTTNCN